ncbi:MAG: SDR family NAD(P)-dependent oxidoreductase, partial [Planctomycetota bacterium]
LAGIYGPGRVPLIGRLRRGQPIPTSPQGWLNLIHVDDAAAAVMASWDSEAPSRLYAVADDRPVRRGEFYRYVARRAGVGNARFDLSAGGNLSRRSASDKRIWNRRMKRELLPELRFPSYLQGIDQALIG